MRLFRRTNKKTLEDIFSAFYDEADYSANKLDFLVELVSYFRPSDLKETTEVSIQPLLQFLEDNNVKRYAMTVYLQNIVQNRKFTSIITDSGIIKDSNFVREVRERILSKVLPEQPEKDTLQYLLNQIFHRQTDIEWVQTIPHDELVKLVGMLGMKDIYEGEGEVSPLEEMIKGIGLIIQRVSGRALEEDVLRMIPEFADLESPFEKFEKLLDDLTHRIIAENKRFVSKSAPDYISLTNELIACQQLIEAAFNNSAKYGISLRVNQSLLRIRQQLARIAAMLPLLAVDSENEKVDNSISLGLKLIRYNCKKNNIRRLLMDSTQTLAYEVTQHTAKTGEHYITQSKNEYWHMLYTAMGAGLVVGFLCIFKIYLGKAEVSDFGHAFLYSMNYAFGFILIYLLGFTLATKQPAMTAAAIVSSIEHGIADESNVADRHRSFAILFSRLFRSQFIAFVGNVVIAFPVALLLIWLIQGLGQVELVDAHKSQVLLDDINPLASMAIFHASIAGVFLFLSGIISGSISNKMKHNKIYNRIKEHPVLKSSLGVERTERFASWMEQKWAGVASNFWFGVFMGSTVSVGIFLGLNIDIRHITFVSGNLAIGLFGADFQTGWYPILMGIIGIGVIGFFNFIVSFSLSLWLALRSRAIPLSEVKYLFQSVWLYFKYKPWNFFYPTRE